MEVVRVKSTSSLLGYGTRTGTCTGTAQHQAKSAGEKGVFFGSVHDFPRHHSQHANVSLG
jgi:hypothetical protein